MGENYSNCLLNPSKAIISEACSNKVTCCVLFQVRLRQQFPWRSSLVPVVHLESKACRLLRDHQSSPHSSRIFLDLTDHPTDNSSGGVTCTEIIYNSWLNTGSPPRIHWARDLQRHYSLWLILLQCLKSLWTGCWCMLDLLCNWNLRQLPRTPYARTTSNQQAFLSRQWKICVNTFCLHPNKFRHWIRTLFDGVLLKENRSKHINQSDKKKITNENSDKYKLPRAAIYLNIIGSRN